MKREKAMSTAALMSPAGLPLEGTGPARWIISRREDLTWFIGSALSGYLALGLMAAGAPLLPIFLFWLLLVDGPHVLSTVTRTYFDRAERARLGWFLWIPLPLFLVGPSMAWAGQAALFYLLAVCWQQFHIVKQHFGFVMLYKAKNKERDRRDYLLDRWFLLTSLWVPLGLFVLRTRPSVSAAVPLHWLAMAAIGAYAALAAGWMLRQVQKFRVGLAMNWPKLGLLAAVVPLQWLALLYASHFRPAGILRAGIALGLFHSFQYHRLMWFHNRNRYTEPGAAERNGLAARLATNLAKYLAVAIGLHFLLSYVPQALFPSQTMQAAFWGIAFTHYMLDARIWHVRSDQELAAALRMR
jgi:hypothetical protein